MEPHEKIQDLLKKIQNNEEVRGDVEEKEEDLKPLPMSRSDSVEVAKEGIKKDEVSPTSAISLVKSFI